MERLSDPEKNLILDLLEIKDRLSDQDRMFAENMDSLLLKYGGTFCIGEKERLLSIRGLHRSLGNFRRGCFEP